MITQSPDPKSLEHPPTIERIAGGTIAHALFVKRDVRAIFAYRARVMLELLG